MSSIKIAIITPYFLERLGYQEVSIAHTLRNLGYKVRVFTTSETPRGVKVRTEDFLEVKWISRFKVRRRLSSTFWMGAEWLELIHEFNPDRIVLINVPSGFGRRVVRDKKLSEVPMTSFYSDAGQDKKTDSARAFLRTSLEKTIRILLGKKSWYREAFERSHRIVANTPETQNILQRLGASDTSKILCLPLGVDSNSFSFNPKQNSNSKTTIGITVTKLQPHKGLESFFKFLIKWLKRNPQFEHWVVGGQSDRFQESLPKHPRLKVFGFLNSKELSELYNSAHFGIWTQATIAIQEGMFTGLPVILPDGPVVSHLIQDSSCGFYYRDLNEVTAERILDLKKVDRSKVSQINSFLDYRKILNQALSLNERQT